MVQSATEGDTFLLCGVWPVPRFSYFPRQRKRAEGMPSDLCVISNLYLSPRSLAKKAVSFPGSRLSRALSLLLEFSPLHQ